MNLPTLTAFERLLPLDRTSVGETWLGRVTSADGLELVLIESFSSEISDREDLCERIVRGADRAASLRHDLIVPTRRAGRLDGQLSVVHAFPSGESLEGLLRRGRPSMQATLRIFANIADTLADVHQHSAFHGALHPAVVTIGWDGRTRLHKFGTEQWVRKVRHDWGELNTRQLSYLAPEHCMNDPLDERTDIFNAGILLWELLTGRLLYEEDDDFERMRAICEREAPPPTRFNDKVPPLLNSLTLKALSIEPAERFADGADLLSAFEGVLSRAGGAPTYKHVVQSFQSVAPERLEGWKIVEQARRQNNLEAALHAIGELYGVDPSQAPPIGGPRPPGPADRVDTDTDTDVTGDPYGDTPTDTGREGLKSDGVEARGFEFEEVDEVPTTIDEQASSADGDWPSANLDEPVDDETLDTTTGEIETQLDAEQDDGIGEQRSAQSLLLEEDDPDPTDHTTTLESDDIETISVDEDIGDSSAAGGAAEPAPDPPDGGGIRVPGGDPESAEVDEPTRAERPSARDDEPRSSGRHRTDSSGHHAPTQSDPDDLGAELQSMSIDEWLDDEEEDDEEFREPFSLDRVIEDQGRPEQERVRKPVLEVIRLGQNQPLDVSVLRGRQRWAIDGEPIEVAAKGNEGAITIRPPVEGWIARASSPGDRNALPSPPSEIKIQPGDVAQMTDGDVTYRVRFFHPPKSPNHIERENMGRKISFYGVAVAVAVVLHALAGFGIVTLHTSFGVAMSVGDKPKKEVFAEGKLKKIEETKKKKKKKQKKEPPEPPEPEPEPADPSEQEAEVPEQVQDELDKRMEEKQKQAENKSEAEALAAAFEGSGEDSKDSIKDAVSNIDAADSPSDSGALEVGGKIKPSEGNDIQITQGDGESKLGDIGSDIDSSTGKLTGRDKEGEVRGTVESVDSQTKVEGQLAREKVAKVIQQHQGEIQGCYERELLSNAGLAGKVTFEWTITRQGNVSGAREKSSTLNSAAVSNCILEILRDLKFPKPKGGSVTISYPFMFRSGG